MKRETPKEVWLHHHERTGWTLSFDPPLKRYAKQFHRMTSDAEVRRLRKVERCAREFVDALDVEFPGPAQSKLAAALKPTKQMKRRKSP